MDLVASPLIREVFHPLDYWLQM